MVDAGDEKDEDENIGEENVDDESNDGRGKK